MLNPTRLKKYHRNWRNCMEIEKLIWKQKKWSRNWRSSVKASNGDICIMYRCKKKKKYHLQNKAPISRKPILQKSLN